MKHLLFVAGLICSFGIQAQLTGISVETYMVHDGVVNPELSGFTTYHVYANTTSAEDFVSAIFGDSDYPMGFSSTGTVFQSTPGFNYGSEVNPALFTALQLLEYDSWITIGMLSADDNGSVSNVGMSTAMSDFTTLGSFYIDDPIGGSWFYPGFPCGVTPIPTCAGNYAAFGGIDNKVLLAQITTNGSFTGVFNVQIFVGGDQGNTVNYNGFGFSTDPLDVFGCTDIAASNYNAAATVDDYSCVLPCTLSLVVDTVVSPTCNGDNDGSLIITATGAQGSDDYYFGQGDLTPSNFGNFNNLVANDYFILVQDGAGCQDSAYVTVPVTPAVSLVATLTESISCNNANNAVIEVTSASGGDGNLQFYIQGDLSTITTSTLFPGLSSGTVTIVGIDGNGCMGTSIANFIANPAPVTIYVTGFSDASCANIDDGVIVVSATGGSAPLTIDYSIDGVNNFASPLYVSAGTYFVTGTDVNGCSGTSVEVVIGPDPITVNATSTPVACTDDLNGVVSWAPVGGVGNFTVSVGDSTLTTTSYEGLAPGLYTVIVSDGNGCTFSEDTEILNAVPVVASADVISVTCNGGTDGIITVSGTGGTGTFQYSDDGNMFFSVNEFNNLLAGSYTVFAQDENGCVSDVIANVTEPDAIVISGFASEGQDSGNAVIDISVTGGTPGYTYDWIGPGVNGITTQDLDGLSSGTYTVEVTDLAGCSEVSEFNVVTGLYEIATGVSAQIFPNPSSGIFQVRWEGLSGGNVFYNVIDARGRQVSQGTWMGVGSSFQSTLDLSGVENGLYRLNVIVDGVPTSIQLMKAN